MARALIPRAASIPKARAFSSLEYYGWNGKPNEGLRMTNTEIARQIRGIEAEGPYAGRVVSLARPIRRSLMSSMAPALPMKWRGEGIRWEPAQKGPGSRRQGAQLLRQRLKASRRWPMEEPGLFIFSTCRQWLRTVPIVPRDPKNPDDVDSASEDHIYDVTRYELSMPRLGCHADRWRCSMSVTARHPQYLAMLTAGRPCEMRIKGTAIRDGLCSRDARVVKPSCGPGICHGPVA